MDTIGFLELSSIAGGVEIADAMLKAGQVELVFAKASCPGKYYIMIYGFVSSVQNSIERGRVLGKGYVVDSLVLPKIHPQVVQAINMSSMPERTAAIGVMEFFSVTASVIAADTAVKAASVELLDVRLGTGIGGKSFVVLTGDTSSVKTAVDAAVQNHSETGMLLNKTVIANPRRELVESLF